MGTTVDGNNQVLVEMKKYLEPAGATANKSMATPDPASFTSIPAVHGACKNVFDKALKTFLQEMNSLTEIQLFQPAKDPVASDSNASRYSLALALDQLAVTLAPLGILSNKRTSYLLSGQRGLPPMLQGSSIDHSVFEALDAMSTTLALANKQLVIPASSNIAEDIHNPALLQYQGPAAGTKCLQLVEQIEKILAIELIIAVHAFNTRKPVGCNKLASQLAADFSAENAAVKTRLPGDIISNSVRFMRARKTIEASAVCC
jgi:histidine ammonia-lyase